MLKYNIFNRLLNCPAEITLNNLNVAFSKLHLLICRFLNRSSGPILWLQIQTSGFDSRHYQVLWQIVGLERGPFSLVSTIVELAGRKSSGSGLENREYGHRDPSRWPRGTLYQQKLALTSPKRGGRSASIVPSRTQATEFSLAALWSLTNQSHFQCKRQLSGTMRSVTRLEIHTYSSPNE
jgi:hypothetical protein